MGRWKTGGQAKKSRQNEFFFSLFSCHPITWTLSPHFKIPFPPETADVECDSERDSEERCAYGRVSEERVGSERAGSDPEERGWNGAGLVPV